MYSDRKQINVSAFLCMPQPTRMVQHAVAKDEIDKLFICETFVGILWCLLWLEIQNLAAHFSKKLDKLLVMVSGLDKMVKDVECQNDVKLETLNVKQRFFPDCEFGWNY